MKYYKTTFILAGLLALGVAQSTLAYEPAETRSLPLAETGVWVGAELRIETADKTIYDGTVYTNGCTVTDSEGGEHVYAMATALCALDMASQLGEFDYVVQDSSFGLYISAIDGVEATTDYWSFFTNYEYATIGAADYELKQDDAIIFSYGGYPNSPLKLRVRKKQTVPGQEVLARVKETDSVTGALNPVAGVTVMFGETSVVTDADGYASAVINEDGTDVEVYALQDGSTRSNKSIIRTAKKNKTQKPISEKKRQLMANRATSYLLKQVDETGLVGGSQSTTEWTAMALGSVNRKSKNIRQAVLSYEPTVEDGTAELARHILALEALGIDSRNANSINYVSRLKQTESNDQFGSELYVNDDIFAGLALLAADEPYSSNAVATALRASKAGINDDGGVSYIVAAVKSDLDTTGYFIQLLSAVQGMEKETGVKTNTARRNSYVFLKKQQNLDGGWDYQRSKTDRVESNASTTAVVLQGIQSVNQKPDHELRNKRSGFNVLNSLQRKSGGFMYNESADQSIEELNTAYAVTALVQQPLPIK